MKHETTSHPLHHGIINFPCIKKKKKGNEKNQKTHHKNTFPLPKNQNQKTYEYYTLHTHQDFERKERETKRGAQKKGKEILK